MSQTTKVDTAADFEFFQGHATESRTKAQITVRRGGLMVITQAAVEMLGDEVEHVQLAYSEKTGSVGIRSTTDDASGGNLLRTQKKSPSRLVGGKRFFQHHGLDIDKARTYDAEDSRLRARERLAAVAGPSTFS